MKQTSENFPTEVADLPEAQPTELVELADGDEFELTIAPVVKQLGDSRCGCWPTTARSRARPCE